jgi:hypothetical protein
VWRPDYLNRGQDSFKQLRLVQNEVVDTLLVRVCSDYLYDDIMLRSILRENSVVLE